MTGPLLACQGLSRRFGGLLALDALSFQLPEDSVLGLIGPNGSGKTTFFNVLTGIYPPSAGELFFAGQPLSGLSPQRVFRAGIARTFQRSRLCLPLSIFDNVALGELWRLETALVANLLGRKRLRAQLAKARESVRDLLHGFDPALARRLDEPAAAVPMIDRRRIEICRALISSPRLLLLDEPSAGMTHDETMRLMDDILAARERLGRPGIIIIEHEMAVIERITHRCLVLDYGKKLREGTFQEVARDPLVQQAYLGIT
ncbi:MAG: ABC transporter ATP-binding protein [Acidobacteriota bacterium]|nr:ABC transporter ATP-binding protein [Acidobacteriota bacterium]